MSSAPMAPGTAPNEAGVVAVWASAGGFISRLPPAIPMASPIANDNPTVTVLLITFLPARTTRRSCLRTFVRFFARSRLKRHCIPEVLLFELLRGGAHHFCEHAVHLAHGA